MLVDGSLLNPLPIVPTISAQADIVVAVNLSGEDDRRRKISDAAFSVSGDDDDTDEWMNTFRDRASRWFDWDTLKSLGVKKPVGGDSPEEKMTKQVQKKSTKGLVRRSCRKSTRPLIGISLASANLML